jgi:hypothetical protein
MRRSFFAFVAVLAPLFVTMQASADTGQPAELYVRIGWTHAAEKPGTENNMVTPHIVVAPGHMIVSSTTLFMMEASANANNLQSPCKNSDVVAYFVCQDKAMARHAVFLPLAVSPQKCQDMDNKHDLMLRLCVTMLQYKPDRYRLEFEEAQEVKYVPTETCIQPLSATICWMSVERARFDLTLTRDAAGSVTGCNVKTFAAFTFRSQTGQQMIPFDRIKEEKCGTVLGGKVIYSQ